MHFKSLRRCEVEWIKIGVDTGAGKTSWPQSITYGTTVISLSARQLENLSKVANECMLRFATIGSNLRVRGVQAPVCEPLLPVGEHTTMGGVIVLYGDKGCMFHKSSNVAKNIDAWIRRS